MLMWKFLKLNFVPKSIWVGDAFDFFSKREGSTEIELPAEKVYTEELKELKKQIKDTWKDIKNHKFERTKDYKICEKCEYKDHCYPGGIPTSK